jgi:hypothetical protein
MRIATSTRPKAETIPRTVAMSIGASSAPWKCIKCLRIINEINLVTWLREKTFEMLSWLRIQKEGHPV